MRSRPRARRNPALAALLIALVCALGVLAAALLVLLLNTSAIANHVKDRAAPELSRRLGREITLGPVRARILPRPSAEISGVKVPGADGEPVLFEAGRATATVELWPLLRSLGRDVRVSSLELRDARVNVVRRADGSWSYEDLKRLSSSGSGSSSASPGREYVISELSLRNAALALFDASRGGEAAVALDRIDATARDLGPGRPLTVNLEAAFAADAPNLRGSLTLDPLPADLASLGPGHLPRFTGHLSVKDARLDRLAGLMPARLDALLSGGRASLETSIFTDAAGAYGAKGEARLDAVQLRGQPANGGFTFAASVQPSGPEALRVRLSQLTLSGPGIRLGGSVELQAEPLRARFDLQGPLLDLDTLLALKPRQPDGASGGATSRQLVPATVREKLAAASLSGSLALDQLRSGALQASQLRAQLELARGVLTVKDGSAQLYGGALQLAGTRVDLLAEQPVWDLKATLDGVELGTAIAQVTHERPLNGRVKAALDLHGDGNDWQQLRQQLTGAGSMALQEGELSTSLDEKVAQALALVGQGALAGKVEAGQGTALKDLSASFTVKDGWLRLSRPLSVTTSFGTASLSGRVALDRRLDLSGQLALAPSFISRLSGGRLLPGAPVEVPLSLGGTLSAPEVKLALTPDQAARLLASSAGGAAGRALQRQVQGRLKGFLKQLRPGGHP